MLLRPVALACAVAMFASCNQSSSHPDDGGSAGGDRLTKAQVVQRFSDIKNNRVALQASSSPDTQLPPLSPLSEVVDATARPLDMSPSASPRLSAGEAANQDIDLSNFDTDVKNQKSRGWCT